MPNRAVVFDVNGVLWGTSSPEKRAMREFGIPYTDEVHSRVQRAVCGAVFKDWGSYLSGFAESLGIEDTLNNQKRLRDLIYSELEGAVKVIPESRDEVLSGLKKEGYLIALVSNCYPPTRQFLKQQGIIQHADVPFLSYERGITKQTPRIYNKVLNELEVAPENAIMIGDNIFDDIIQSKRATKGKIGGVWINLKDEACPNIGFEYYTIDALKEVPECVEDFFKVET